MQVGTLTNLKMVFEKKPYLANKIAKMVWMAGAIDVPGNLEESQWDGFPKMTDELYEAWGCAAAGDPPPCQCGAPVNALMPARRGMAKAMAGTPVTSCGAFTSSWPEWNVWGDVPAADYIFRTTTFPIFLAPLDLADQLPIPNDESGEGFMKTLYEAKSPECNQLIYNAINESYATFAAPQFFYRLWDSSAVMYGLAPELFGETETVEMAVGTAWDYQGLLIRKSEAEMGMPSPDDFVNTCKNSPVAYREITIVKGLANGPQPVFDYAVVAACAKDSPGARRR